MSPFIEQFDLRSTIEGALPRHFSYRKGKLGPARTMLTLVNMRIFGQRGYRRVLNELKDGLRTHLGWLWDDKPSSAALCKSRKKLTRDHCQVAFNAVYDRCALARQHAEVRYDGRSIVTFDGTRLRLPDAPGLADHFGYPSNQHGTGGHPTAGLILLWDVSSQQPVNFRLVPYRHSEPAVAQEMFDELPDNSLLLTDRGFPSYEICADLLRRNQDFVIRMAKNQGKAVRSFVASEERDAEVSWEKPQHVHASDVAAPAIRLRLIKVRLPSGEDEILATNLKEQDGHQALELGRLYTTRWRIETAFREMKVWHALEDFSAHHVLGIHQEVTAALIFALMVGEIEAKIREEKAHLVERQPDKPLPTIRYNRLMIADAVVGLLVASAAGPKAVHAHLERCIEAIWRNREKRRVRPPQPRKRKQSAKGTRR